MFDKLITYIVCWYKTFIRSCLLCELTASLLIAITNMSALVLPESLSYSGDLQSHLAIEIKLKNNLAIESKLG